MQEESFILHGSDRSTEECGKEEESIWSVSSQSTHLAYTGLCGGLGHLKIEMRLRGERFESVKGEYVI